MRGDETGLAALMLEKFAYSCMPMLLHHTFETTVAPFAEHRALVREGVATSYGDLAEKFECSRSVVAKLCRYERRCQTPAKPAKTTDQPHLIMWGFLLEKRPSRTLK